MLRRTCWLSTRDQASIKSMPSLLATNSLTKLFFCLSHGRSPPIRAATVVLRKAAISPNRAAATRLVPFSYF